MKVIGFKINVIVSILLCILFFYGLRELETLKVINSLGTLSRALQYSIYMLVGGFGVLIELYQFNKKVFK